MRLGERRTGGWFQEIPGRLHRLEGIDPIDADRERAPDHLGLARTAYRHANGEPARPQRIELGQNGAIVEDAALERRRMDLIEVEVLIQQSSALRDLPSQRCERVILHLVDASIDLPVTDVGITPLRTHRDRVRWEPALAQP